MSKKNKIKVSPPDMGSMPPPTFMATTFASTSDKANNANRSAMISKRRSLVSQKKQAKK
jgi:hypothetical protein